MHLALRYAPSWNPHTRLWVSALNKTSIPSWSVNNAPTCFRPELLLHLANGLKLMRGQVIMATARIMLMRVLRNAISWKSNEGQMRQNIKAQWKKNEAHVEKSNILQYLTTRKINYWLFLDRFCYSEFSASPQGRTCPVCQSAACFMIMDLPGVKITQLNVPDTEVKNIM